LLCCTRTAPKLKKSKPRGRRRERNSNVKTKGRTGLFFGTTPAKKGRLIEGGGISGRSHSRECGPTELGGLQLHRKGSGRNGIQKSITREKKNGSVLSRGGNGKRRGIPVRTPYLTGNLTQGGWVSNGGGKAAKSQAFRQIEVDWRNLWNYTPYVYFSICC